MLAILAAVMLAAAPQHDTVFTADGGRVVGTVIEEGPEGISVLLPDGTSRKIPRAQVTRIEYADGSVSTFGAPGQGPPPRAQPPSGKPPPSAPPEQQPPPRRYPPPSYPPYPPYAPYAPPPPPRLAPAPWPAAPIQPLYFSIGLAGALPFGEVEDGVDIDRVFKTQVDVNLEGGFRLSPHLALGLYLDYGYGNPARETRDACREVGIDCDAYRTRFGVLLRYTFAPAARITPWLSAGAGHEWGTIVGDDYYDDDQFSYRGWELARLMAGIDLRSSPVLGVGLYGGVALGRYYGGDDALGDFDIDRERFHTTVMAGLRLTLFP